MTRQSLKPCNYLHIISLLLLRPCAVADTVWAWTDAMNSGTDVIACIAPNVVKIDDVSTADGKRVA